jgi:hypothetical protein
MNRIALITAVTLGAILLTSSAWATPAFLSDIPNATTNSCMTCHTSTSPAAWNSFGDDVKANLAGELPDWAAICDLDSDEDGATNGAELGDVDCVWVKGDGNPAGDVFHPGDAESAPEADPEPEPEPEPEPGDDDPVDPEDGSTDEGADGSTDEGADGSTDEGADGSTDEGTEDGDDDSASDADDGTDDGEATDDGGCQGGPATPLSVFFALMCAGILARRRLA